MEIIFIFLTLMALPFVMAIGLIAVIVIFMIESLPYVLAFFLILFAIGVILTGGVAIVRILPDAIQTVFTVIFGLLGVIIIGSPVLALVIFLFGLLISPLVFIFSLVEFKTLFLCFLALFCIFVCFWFSQADKEKGSE
jgi:membrane protein|nr:MAG TPA: hypothetical protein [Caudoviricetes sp.]